MQSLINKIARIFPAVAFSSVKANQQMLPEPFDFNISHQNGKVRMQMVYKTGSYIGIGFGDVTSKGTDMIMCNSTGSVGAGECHDMHSVWVDMATPPQKDAQ